MKSFICLLIILFLPGRSALAGDYYLEFFVDFGFLGGISVSGVALIKDEKNVYRSDSAPVGEGKKRVYNVSILGPRGEVLQTTSFKRSGGFVLIPDAITSWDFDDQRSVRVNPVKWMSLFKIESEGKIVFSGSIANIWKISLIDQIKKGNYFGDSFLEKFIKDDPNGHVADKEFFQQLQEKIGVCVKVSSAKAQSCASVMNSTRFILAYLYP